MSLSWQLGLYLFLTPVLALSTFSQSLTQSCKAALPTETTASAHNDLQSGTRAQIRNSVSREKLDQHPLKFLKLEPRLDWDVDVFQGFPDYITCDVRKEGKQPRVFKDQLILAMRFGIESGPANVYESYLMPEVNFVWSRESVRQKPDTHGDNPKEISYNVISFKYVSHQSVLSFPALLKCLIDPANNVSPSSALHSGMVMLSCLDHRDWLIQTRSCDSYSTTARTSTNDFPITLCAATWHHFRSPLNITCSQACRVRLARRTSLKVTFSKKCISCGTCCFLQLSCDLKTDKG